ncbi:MAG: serine/threonine-protein kinase HipA [Pseudonocardiales bacterium]|nr:serine/threonine-protein kinase HipA [Pseudonocardiales bacterium]
MIALAYWALGAGNNDDHARNHAAFWDGDRELLTLTPAYDITPQPRGAEKHDS